jgi:protein-tyrosine phosphatase
VPTGATLKSIPVSAGVDGDTSFFSRIRNGELQDFSADDLADYYSAILQEFGPELGEALRVCADPDNLPVLVHCASGKDRTGLVVALLLEVLGVERHHVVAEYGLTELLRPDRVMDFAAMLDEAGAEPARVAVLFQSPPEAMAKALRNIDAEFGSVTQFLTTSCGVSAEMIEDLRAAAITHEVS